MTTVLEFSSHEDKQERLDQFDPSKETWLVSDLTSKFQIQKRLLESRDILEEDAVLRANEFWQKLLHRHFPEMKIVSRELFASYVNTWMLEDSTLSVQHPGTANSLLQYFEQLSPLLFHVEGAEVFTHWLKKEPSAFIRWGHWALLCLKLIEKVKVDKLICGSWISGYLSSQVGENLKWSRPLVVDLGADLQRSEIDLIQQMAKGNDLHWTLFYPQRAIMDFYPDLFHPYADSQLIERQESVLENSKSNFEETLGALLGDIQNQELLRPATQISEVKDLCGKIHNYLDEGGSPKDICILAPDIETYWPMLKRYFVEEGIPWQKNSVFRLQSLPWVQSWMSKMNIKLKNFSKEDIEWMMIDQDFSSLSVHEFNRVFNVIFGADDLERNLKVKKLYKTWIEGSEIPYLMSRDEFIIWTVSCLPKNFNLDHAQPIYNQIYKDCFDSHKMVIPQWINYLSKILAKTELRIEDSGEVPWGVRLENFNSSHWLNNELTFFLGLNEQSMKQLSPTAISSADVFSIEQNTGFKIHSSESSLGEFNCLQAIKNQKSKKIIYSPKTSFSGSELGPAKIFLLFMNQMNMDYEKTDSPSPSVWDYIQQFNVHELCNWREWSEEKKASLEAGLAIEKDSSKNTDFSIPKHISFSASRLESYIVCPFKFYAEKILGLVDLPSVDFDMDRLSGGLLIHKLFEEASSDFDRYSNNEEQEKLVRNSIRDLGLSSLSEELLELQVFKYKDWINRFIEAEKSWKKNHPLNSIYRREFRFKVFWDRVLKKWTEMESSSTVPLTGVIDRVDSDGEDLNLIVDYKSSTNSLTHHSSWSKKGHLQLPIYAQVMDVLEPEKKTVAAQFYGAKDFNRDKGFQLKGLPEEIADKESRYNGVDLNQLAELYKESNKWVDEVVEGVMSSQFRPEPKDKTHCSSCSWRNICRASHLN